MYGPGGGRHGGKYAYEDARQGNKSLVVLKATNLDMAGEM
jgi:hypothetical protein